MTNVTSAANDVFNAFNATAWTPQDPNRTKGGLAEALRAVSFYCGQNNLVLQSIADELDGIKYGIYRCNIQDQPQTLHD